MRVYGQINALPPAGIGKKSAHVIGAGIGGLSAAAFLSTTHKCRLKRATAPVTT